MESCRARVQSKSYFPEEPDYSKCEHAQVKATCSLFCNKRPDTRHNALDAYTYDCQALTRTKMDSTQCGITVQFKNCEAYKGYQNGVESLAAPAKMIALFALAAMAFMLF